MRGTLACMGRNKNAYSDLRENRREADDLSDQMYNTRTYLKIVGWGEGMDCFYLNFIFSRASDLYLCLYNQLFVLFTIF